MNNNEKQLFSYIHKTFKNLLIGVALMLLGIAGICGFIALISSDGVKIIKFGSLIFSVVFVWLGFTFIKDEPKERKNIKDILKTEAGKEMIFDFPNAKKYFSDSFRLGQKFLFIKDKEVPLFTSKIKIVGVPQNQDFSYSLSVLMEDGSLIKLKNFNQSEFNKNKEEIDAFLKEITILNSEILVKA